MKEINLTTQNNRKVIRNLGIAKTESLQTEKKKLGANFSVSLI